MWVNFFLLTQISTIYKTTLVSISQPTDAENLWKPYMRQLHVTPLIFGFQTLNPSLMQNQIGVAKMEIFW